jgi:hypothetical protein
MRDFSQEICHLAARCPIRHSVEIPLVALQLAQQEVYQDKGSERKKTF